MSNNQPQTDLEPNQPAKPDPLAKQGMPDNKVEQAKPANAPRAKPVDAEKKRRY